MVVMSVMVVCGKECVSPTKGDQGLFPGEKYEWMGGSVPLKNIFYTCQKNIDWVCMYKNGDRCPYKHENKLSLQCEECVLLRVGAPLVGLDSGVMKWMKSVTDGLF